MRPIDADALVEMFKTQYECETCDNYDGVRCRACHCDDALGIIDSAHTIDAAPVRRGEWEHGKRNGAYGIWCSRCGTGWEESLNYEVIAANHDFCPNCGADMRRADDGR